MESSQQSLRLLLAAAILLSVLQVPLAAALETWTSTDGRSLEAEVIEITGEKGSLVAEMRRADGMRFSLPVSRFAKPDQVRLREIFDKQQELATLLQPGHRIDLRLKLNRTTEVNDSWTYYNWTDKTKVYSPEVFLKNSELIQSFTGNTVRIVIIAKDLRYKDRLLIASAKTVPIDLPAKSEVTVEGGFFGLRSEEYRSSYSTYNWEYGYEKDDYVIVLMNRNGEITHTKASRSKFLEHMDNVMNCRSGEIYSDDLVAKMNLKPNSYYSGGE